MNATFYPQFADSVKRHDFSVDTLTLQKQQVILTTSDSAAIKKKEERKKRKEEREKKKKEAAEKKQAKKDLLKNADDFQVLIKKEKSVISSNSLKASLAKSEYIPLNTTFNSLVNENKAYHVLNKSGFSYFIEPESHPNNDSANVCKTSTQSFFTGHELSIKQLSGPTAISRSPYWINGFILIVIAIFVWVQTSYQKRFSRIVAAFFNIREFFQLVREEYTMTNALSIVLSIIYIFTASLFMYQVNSYYHIFSIADSPIYFYLTLVGIISSCFLFKLVFVRIIGIIFYTKSDQALPFVYNIFLTNNIIGILLIPVSIFLAYAIMVPQQTTIIVAIIFILGLYIYRIFRSLRFSISDSGGANLYFFSYLCTLDLVPFIVLLKQLTNRF